MRLRNCVLEANSPHSLQFYSDEHPSTYTNFVILEGIDDEVELFNLSHS